MTICFLSVCQFNEFSGGIDRVCCLLSREFARRGYHQVCVYGNNSALGHPAEDCDGDGQYQFPYTIWDDRNILFFSDVVTKHHVDIVIDVAYIARYHDVAYQAKQKTPFKLITAYHGDPEGYLKEVRDKFDCISFLNIGIKAFFLKIFFLFRLPISYYLKKISYKDRLRKCVMETDYYLLLTNTYVERVKSFLPSQLRDKVCYIYNPINFENLIQREEFKNKRNQVLFVGQWK